MLESKVLLQDEAAELLEIVGPIADTLRSRLQRSQPEIVAPSLFRYLEGTELVAVVLGNLDAADAMCAAFACRKFRDALLQSQFPLRKIKHRGIGVRLMNHGAWLCRFGDEATRTHGYTMNLSRFHWARSLGGLRRQTREADEVCVSAAEHGALDVLQEARALGYPCDEQAMECAALGGHLHVIKYLRSLPASDKARRWAHMTGICSAAAEGGHLDVLRWIRVRKAPWDEETCECAAKAGHLHILQWARKNHCPWDARTPYAAIEGTETSGSHADIFFWAVRNGCPLEVEDAFIEAGGRGLLTVLDYLIDAASEPELNDLHDPYGHTLGPMLRRAAEAGQLEVLKWARDKELPIDAGGTDPGGVLHEWLDHAQCESQWHVLEWAWAQGYPFNDELVLAAIEEPSRHGPEYGNADKEPATLETGLEFLQWVHKKGYEMPTQACQRAIAAQKLETLKWLRSHGVCWGDDPLSGVHIADIYRNDAYEWAVSHGAPARSLLDDGGGEVDGLDDDESVVGDDFVLDEEDVALGIYPAGP